MKFTITATAALLAGAAFAATPAAAQQTYGAQAAPQTSASGDQQDAQAKPAAQAAQGANVLKTHVPKVSREAGKAIQELQKAVNENNTAAIPAALQAAQAAAKTGDDRYVVALLQLKAAANAKDSAGIASALEAMLASGSVLEEEKYSVYINLAQTYSAMKVSDRAAQAYQQALQLNPNSVEATAGMAEALVAQGKANEALQLLQKGIALQSAGGARPSEIWYKRALQVAWKGKLPQAIQISRDWVKAYPTSASWRDALAIYQNLGQLDETRTLDLLRLKRATKSLVPADYFTYADLAVRKGLSGEAKAVLDEGFAANAIKRTDPSFSQLYKLASDRTKGDRESLAAAPQASANARQTMIIGDAYYGYGEYAKAVEFYRAALGKPEADKDLLNLRLGMALARQGDKAGATAALGAVGGANSELAKYWLLYLSTQA
ncbi:MAG: tetratricopeptide repeat protein [Alphaproteobacteria bacterium]